MITYDTNFKKLKLHYNCKDKCDDTYYITKSVIINNDAVEYVSDQLMNLIGLSGKGLIEGLSIAGLTPALIVPDTGRFKNIYLTRVTVKPAKIFVKE